jgi:small subunit ribosomal protein S3
MGQKVNPIGYRLSLYNNWKSKWFAKGKQFAEFLLEDVKIRETIMKKMGPQASISEIIIERGLGRLNITIHSARPGVIIGRGGKSLESLRADLSKGLPGKKFKLDIIEIKKADLDANVVAQSIGMQISKRMPFRRASKQALQKVIGAGAKGARISVAGRLDGAEIARREVFSDGSVPLTTLRNDIDFAVYHAPTTFGTVGVKVWINRGEKR